jgi:hypothetical protein
MRVCWRHHVDYVGLGREKPAQLDLSQAVRALVRKGVVDRPHEPATPITELADSLPESSQCEFGTEWTGLGLQHRRCPVQV